MGYTGDKMKGKMKKAAGKATGNKRMQAEGAYQEGTAKLKQELDNKFYPGM